MKPHCYLLINMLLVAVIPNILFAQKNPSSSTQNMIIEVMGFEFESDENQDYLEALLEFYQNPIDLNLATGDDLRRLGILSENQISNLLEHIKKTGKLHSKYELQSIPGFDMNTISKLMLFADVKAKSVDPKGWTGFLLSRYSQLLQKKSGFLVPDEERAFTGPSYGFLTKIRARNAKKIDLGITIDKDPGEPVIKARDKGRWGPDFSSGYVEINGLGRINKMIVGDFLANWGQGLVFGQGFSMGKGRMTTGIHKHVSTGITPHRSSAEYGFMRGLALSIGRGPAEISLMISSNNIDGNVNQRGEVTSVPRSGLHRNLLEMSKQNVVNKKIAGINARFRSPGGDLAVGASSVYTYFDHPFHSQDTPANRFKFRGNHNHTSGLFLEYRKRNFVVFGEGAMNGSGSGAYIIGGLATLSHQLEALILSRNFSPGFTSFYSENVFRESSLSQNEQGVYWGLRFMITPEITLSGYSDLYKFPWLRSSIDMPSNGADYMMDLNYVVRDHFQIKAYFKTERKKVNTAADPSPGIMDQISKTLKIDGKLDLSPRWSYSAGIWNSWFLFEQKSQKGTLVYTGLNYKSPSFSAHFLTSLTDSRDFNTRFYMYEPDVLYTFSFPMYYGQNVKYVLVAKKKLNNKFSGWIKWTSTNFRDRSKFGSGLDQIEGHIKQEIKIQVLYKL